METIYPFLIAFIMVFIAELGDKTQLIVLSFSNSLKPRTILLGVALGSFFSHGLAIMFGSSIGLLENFFFQDVIKMITYASFILMGVVSLLPRKKEGNIESSKKESFVQKLTHLRLGYCFIIALSIMVGELGDKTFLASIGFGIEYPNAKLLLILGAIMGMVVSDSIAIAFGKILNKYISETLMQKVSGILFIIFGFLGFLL